MRYEVGIRAGLITLGLSFVLHGISFAAPPPTELVTPPLGAGTGNSIECVVVNAGTQAHTVTTRLSNSNNTTINTFTETLEPGHSGGFSSPGGGSVCTFTVDEGSVRDLRGAIEILTPNGITVALPAS